MRALVARFRAVIGKHCHRIPRIRTFRVLALAAGGMYLSVATVGCVSNEYVIPKTELTRLSLLPPSQRGMRVQVVQSLGAGGELSSDSGQVLADCDYVNEFAAYDQPESTSEPGYARVDINLPLDGLGGHGRASVAHAPGASGKGGSGWGARAPSPGGTSSSGPRGMGGGGGGNFNFGGGGGGDDLVVFAIILVAVALMAAAGLAVTEGIRYDGFVQLHPEQPVHLKSPAGTQRAIPLAALTPADVAATEEALVMDNEAYGFRYDHRRALDRKGFAFKVDFGSLDSVCGCYSAVGLASNIQLGYFPHHRFGILGTLTLGGGTNALDQTFQRHSANIEAQFFPLQWWRIHLGGFGHGGMQVARDEFGTRTGPAWGGGAILEFALTTRLALTGRMDYTIARTAPDSQSWASSTTLTAGLAIY
ncbi:MAG TPA: hypothetical protein VF550_01480 [Polyangia bacterium]